MESTGKIISFVKRILSQWPSKGTLKIYALGSTLAMLGVVGGLVEALLLPFVEQGLVEDTSANLVTEKKCVWDTDLVRPEVVDMLETVMTEVKASHLTVGQRGLANCLRAS